MNDGKNGMTGWGVDAFQRSDTISCGGLQLALGIVAGWVQRMLKWVVLVRFFFREQFLTGIRGIKIHFFSLNWDASPHYGRVYSR